MNAVRHRDDGGFVLILFVLAVATSVTVLFTALSLYMYPWLEVTKDQNDRARARLDLLLCKDIFVRNISANFFLDDDTEMGDKYFFEDGMTCVFKSSEELSISALREFFPADTYINMQTQYPESVSRARYRIISLVSIDDNDKGRTVYVLLYKNLFMLKEIQSFMFI